MKNIHISDEKKIANIQQEFNRLFPYLKLEFFAIPPRSDQSTAMKFVISSTKTIGESRKIQHDDQVIITPQMTVAELEKQLKQTFWIGVQVFRQSGKAWLETKFTDNWTLEQQNSEGEMLSKVG